MNIDDILSNLKETAQGCEGGPDDHAFIALSRAQDILRECKAAGFIDEKGEVRKVVRRVDVGRHPSDDLDFIVDVLDSGQVVFVCEAARKAGEAAQ